jgi:hypothetical protein
MFRPDFRVKALVFGQYRLLNAEYSVHLASPILVVSVHHVRDLNRRWAVFVVNEGDDAWDSSANRLRFVNDLLV